MLNFGQPLWLRPPPGGHDLNKFKSTPPEDVSP